MSKTEQIIEALTVAYNMELETVLNYICNSINLDGVRAEEIKKALQADITAELAHAQALGRRIKVLGGQVPGSQSLKFEQKTLQPRPDQTDVLLVIKGVIDAEDAACTQYNKLIKICDGIDYVTQDLAIQTLGDEEEHRREFRGFLKEYEKK
jgi:bacterioferritin